LGWHGFIFLNSFNKYPAIKVTPKNSRADTNPTPEAFGGDFRLVVMVILLGKVGWKQPVGSSPTKQHRQ
jgi:hypothetical protein